MTATSLPLNDRAAWLQGPEYRCSNQPSRCGCRAWHVVLLGPPGAGKGTQAELLCQRLGTCHLSTGDVFRAAKTLPANQLTGPMAAALDCMRQGALVPDTTVVALVDERRQCLHCRGGFLLDGFPRTAAQAEFLEKALQEENQTIDAVINFHLPADRIIARLIGRRTCPTCKAVFHVENRRPKTPGVCDHCAAPLMQREDDREEAVRQRLTAYNHTMTPLLDFYAVRNLLIQIPADGSPEQVLSSTLTALTARDASK